MKLHYRAKERVGHPVAGEIDADSVAEARRRLRQQGLYVLSLDAAQSRHANLRDWFAHRRRVKQSDILVAISQLTIMCQSGVNLAEALDNVAQQCPQAALRRILERVHLDVSSGSSFSDALSKHPEAFDGSFVAGVAAGERSGAIIEVLQRLTQLMRGEIRLRGGLWSMLMYPFVLSGVTVVVLSVMVFFVLPQFAKVFSDLGKSPPPLTQLMLGTAQSLRQYSLLLLIAAAGLGVFIWRTRSTSLVARTWDYVTLNGAFVRKATRALCAGRTFRLLGTMLQSGVPLLDGIRLCRAAARNRLFRALFDALEHDVLQGQGIGQALMSASFLPLGAAHMVSTAERSGKLGSVLETVGEYYEDEGERHVRDLVKILEPGIIIVLGAVVAAVVLSIVLPLLDVSTIAQ